MANHFHHRLGQAWQQSGSLVCVGLDPDLSRIPAVVRDSAAPLFEFCKAIVDSTAAYVCAFKPQFAHFAALKAEGQLADVIAYVHDRYPHIPVLLDAKRGDIGSTAEYYAREAFERYNADAVTVSPYLGYESIAPYFDYPDRGVVVLCRTSNPGSDRLQMIDAGGTPLYLRVAEWVKELDQNNQCLLVTGATYPEELGMVREIVGNMPLLVPGIGAQGGDLERVLKNGLDGERAGLLISSSRGILYAGDGPDFAAAAGFAARTLSDQINALRKSSSAR